VRIDGKYGLMTTDDKLQVNVRIPPTHIAQSAAAAAAKPTIYQQQS